MYDRQIGAMAEQLLKYNQDKLEYARNVSLCKSEKKGLFKVYSCRRNTGRTLNDWEDDLGLVNKEIARLTTEHNRLKKERDEAQKAIDVSLDLRMEEAGVDIKESIASGELVKKYGKWFVLFAGVGLVGFIAVKKVRS